MRELDPVRADGSHWRDRPHGCDWGNRADGGYRGWAYGAYGADRSDWSDWFGGRHRPDWAYRGERRYGRDRSDWRYGPDRGNRNDGKHWTYR